MNPLRILGAVAVALALPAVQAAEGLIELESPHGVAETMDRLESRAEARGMNVFARIDHAEGARSVGASLPPTELLIFGNPRGGTPLMQCARTAGIDLPMKALVWEDADGRVRLAYNDPAYLAERHDAADCPAVQGLQEALAALAGEAVAP